MLAAELAPECGDDLWIEGVALTVQVGALEAKLSEGCIVAGASLDIDQAKLWRQVREASREQARQDAASERVGLVAPQKGGHLRLGERVAGRRWQILRAA
jgi:hypothetical protein